MQTRSSDGNSVCQTRDLSQNKRMICVQNFIPYERSQPSFLSRRMVDEGQPLLTEFWVNQPPLERNLCCSITAVTVCAYSSSAVNSCVVGGVAICSDWRQQHDRGRRSACQRSRVSMGRCRRYARTV